MGSRLLKKIRVVISLVFFTSFLLIFIDFRRMIPEDIINGVTWLQFIPSLLKFLNIFTLGAIGFVVVIVLSLLFGRVYCSSVCPLGIMQDIVSWFSKKFKKKRARYFTFKNPHNKLRYSLLILAILAFAFGSVFLINLLDPYSNFGRIMTFFLKPLVIWFNNFFAFLLGKINVYTLFPVEVKSVPFMVFLLQLGILGVIVWMSVFHGRLFCNTICPVGTFLGFLSKFSVFRIRFDKDSCTHCGLCGLACKASCLDVKEQKVDVTRCISCFNCVTVCASNSIVYGTNGQLKKLSNSTLKVAPAEVATDLSKRKFIFGTLAFAFGTVGITRSQTTGMAQDTLKLQKTAQEAQDTGFVTPVAKLLSTVPENREYPVCPPGGNSIDNFIYRCTACNLCVNACPSDVLQPSFLEYGLKGMMQPRMDYWKGFCNFECRRCMDVCPTGALLPIEMDTKKLTQLGIAQFIKDNCIVHTEKTDCGACSEHCPTKAVKMVPYEEDTRLVIPEVEDKICIGCGACEFACPTTPYKAIFINGNFTHKLAEKPKEEAIQKSADEDFPF